MLAIESGNLAEWVGAIGTVAAFMAAAIAFAWNLFATRQDALRAQAVKFGAWVKCVEFPTDPLPEDSIPTRVREDPYREVPYRDAPLQIRVTIAFSNDSNQAIGVARVNVYYERKLVKTLMEEFLVPPTDRLTSETRQFDIPPNDAEALVTPGIRKWRNVRDRFTVGVEFTDAGGWYWRRDSYGRLV